MIAIGILGDIRLTEQAECSASAKYFAPVATSIIPRPVMFLVIRRCALLPTLAASKATAFGSAATHLRPNQDIVSAGGE